MNLKQLNKLMLKTHLTYLTLIISSLSLSQNTITVKKNIEEVEIINETKTDSVTANVQTSIVRLNNNQGGNFSLNDTYCFYGNKVIFFEKRISKKLRKKALKNRTKFLIKISKLKEKNKIDYEIFDATIKEIRVSRVNYITEGGYSYYKINRTTKDTLAQKIILPQTNFTTSIKYNYEIIINGEKFTSPILYSTTLSDNDIIRTITSAIYNKIRKTIPLGYYKSNKIIDKQRWRLLFTSYSYFTNTASLADLNNSKAKTIKVGFDLEDSKIKIESDLPIFSNEGKYIKKSSKIILKNEKTRITFSKK